VVGWHSEDDPVPKVLLEQFESNAVLLAPPTSRIPHVHESSLRKAARIRTYKFARVETYEPKLTD
jgi:hypothetical protein